MVKIREAQRKDCPIILQFIKELAQYEKEPDAVEATVEILEESIFDKKQAKVVLLEENGESVGFALYFFNFSTWRGKAGLYLEDLFVRPQHRGKGYGKMLLSYLANQAVKQGCPRFEWIVLDWNQPSIDFYKAMGAKPLDEWTVFRLENEKLQVLAKTYRISSGLEG
ncbi:MAG: GNAT family N-acetyltransferase [Bacteroidales bacterium]|nr:GNAT family N-acetyltransferase [Bacteroidales bacterium]MEE1226857.1 GNAT family N-acetyltransferase [Bacteroidales bacterium]